MADTTKNIGKINAKAYSSPPIERGKQYFLSIGIDKYADPSVPHLRNAVRDTERLEKTLVNDYGFDVLPGLLNDKATRRNIVNLLSNDLKHLTDTDTLVIFYSGHGFKQNKDGFLVPYDGSIESIADCLPFGELQRIVNNWRMRHVLLILDCCYAGAISTTRKLDNLQNRRIFVRPSRWIIAASDSDELAEDGQKDANSPFTMALVDCLERNQDPLLPIGTLSDNIRSLMNSREVKQNPICNRWQMANADDGILAFLRTNNEESMWQQIVADPENDDLMEGFIALFPNSPHTPNLLIRLNKLKQDEEMQAAFEQIELTRDIGLIQAFLSQYPHSPLHEKVNTIREEVREANAWESANAIGTLSGLQEFLKLYPESLFVDECYRKIRKIKEIAAISNHYWRVKNSQNVEEMWAFIEMYPNSRFDEEIKTLIKEVEEKEIWLKAKSLNQMFSLLEYQSHYPNGRFKNDCERLIKTIKQLIPELIFVRGGTFSMGGQEGHTDEQPVHRVTLGSFFMGKYEVTNEQFSIFLNDKGNLIDGGKTYIKLDGLFKEESCRIKEDNQSFIVEKGYEKYPVIFITWYAAKAYCVWLSEKTGLNFRLPTEAEWEFAATGGDMTNGFQFAGSNSPYEVAWFSGNTTTKVYRVGQKNANELGLYDMSGNVWEWCHDWYDEQYYQKSPTLNPKGIEAGQHRVLRGGSLFNKEFDCRITKRFRLDPSTRSINVGFRIVQSL